MNRIRLKLILAVLISLNISSCHKDSDSSRDLLLTSKTWGKRMILHRPDNTGMWTGTLCGESTNFGSNGEFSRKDDCFGIIVNGKWSWTNPDNQIYIDYEGALPSINNKRVKIIELSDTLLHTMELYDGSTDTPAAYWELKYRHGKN